MLEFYPELLFIICLYCSTRSSAAFSPSTSGRIWTTSRRQWWPLTTSFRRRRWSTKTATPSGRQISSTFTYKTLFSTYFRTVLTIRFWRESISSRAGSSSSRSATRRGTWTWCRRKSFSKISATQTSRWTSGGTCSRFDSWSSLSIIISMIIFICY